MKLLSNIHVSSVFVSSGLHFCIHFKIKCEISFENVTKLIDIVVNCRKIRVGGMDKRAIFTIFLLYFPPTGFLNIFVTFLFQQRG